MRSGQRVLGRGVVSCVYSQKKKVMDFGWVGDWVDVIFFFFCITVYYGLLGCWF